MPKLVHNIYSVELKYLTKNNRDLKSSHSTEESEGNTQPRLKNQVLTGKQQGFVSGVDSLTTISQSEKDSNSAFGLNIQGRPDNFSINDFYKKSTDNTNPFNMWRKSKMIGTEYVYL